MNLPLSHIHPCETNAKKHPKKQIEQIARSIKEFGFNQPLVVDKNNEIVVGHGRFYAAQYLELEEVPIIRLDSLTEEQIEAYRLADNKLNESDWDMALVIESLKFLDNAGLDITITGFDRDLIIEPDDKDDLIPDSVPARAKLGDIWELGRHRIMCGDSTKKEDVEKLMGKNVADCVFTDPPYNVNYKGSGKNTSNGIMNDKMDDEAFLEFLVQTCYRLSEFSKPGAGWYIFHSSSTQDIFKKAIEKSGYEIKNQLIWNKPMAALGWGDYRWKHEPFFYATKKGQSAQFYGDRTHSTIWDFQKTEKQLLNWAKKQKIAETEGKTTIWTMKRDPVQDYVHPTQKPVELITYALTNSSKAGDIILDLFLGSGSTIIAAEKFERNCYGMELDPKYADIIIKRWEDYTNNKAVKL